MILALLAAVLYTLSFPIFPTWWLCFVALVPFFGALEKPQAHWKRFLLGALFGTGLVLGTAHWLFHALVVEFEKSWTTAVLFITSFAILPYALLFGLFALAYGHKKQERLLFYALVIPGLWVATEFLKQVIPGMVPWADLGHATMGGKYFAQIADLVGGYGLSFLVAMANGLLLLLCKAFAKRRHEKNPVWSRTNDFAVGLLVLVMLLPHLYGFLHFARNKKSEAPPMEARVVQASFSQKDRWSGMGFENRLKTYLNLSALDTLESPGVVVWPETVLNSTQRLNDEFFVKLIQTIGRENLLIAGGIRKGPDGRGTFNSAFFVSGEGRVSAYDKHILLPYSETVPAFGDVLGDYYTAPSQYVHGVSPLCVETSQGKFGASICFEILYSAHVRKSVLDGAQFLVNLSNDSWFNSTMPYMHLNAARLRAIEHRRYVLRASNSGFCAVIDPGGQVVTATSLGEKQMIRADILSSTKLTWYSRFGSWIIYASFLCALAGLLTRPSDARKKNIRIRGTRGR